MVKKIIKSLKFLNLIDREGNLSISNIAVIIVLVKLTLSPVLSIVDAGMLLVTLMNYAHKRHSVSKSIKIDDNYKNEITTQISELSKKISDNESNVAAAMLRVGLK